MTKRRVRRIGITGAAGFIGMNLTASLLEAGCEVVGVDSLKPSYGGDLSLKRSVNLKETLGFEILSSDLNSLTAIEIADIFKNCDTVIHLAAWPGVSKGQMIPEVYAENNISVFSKMLSAVQLINPKHFMYASSSSVYGNLGVEGPVSEGQATGTNLLSFYSTTKWINEVEARSRQQFVNFPVTALRFFTVYGPWGRPDMAYWKFLDLSLKGQEIILFGNDGGARNYTFIHDAVKIVSRLIEAPLTSKHREFNIACGTPTDTISLLKAIHEQAKIINPIIRSVPRPSTDIEKTWADLNQLAKVISIPEETKLSDGVARFASWFQELP